MNARIARKITKRALSTGASPIGRRLLSWHTANGRDARRRGFFRGKSNAAIGLWLTSILPETNAMRIRAVAKAEARR